MIVEIKCPSCGDVESVDISRLMFEGYQSKNEEGTLCKVDSEGIGCCYKCHKKFLYRFRTVTVCDTASYPFEEVK